MPAQARNQPAGSELQLRCRGASGFPWQRSTQTLGSCARSMCFRKAGKGTEIEDWRLEEREIMGLWERRGWGAGRPSKTFALVFVRSLVVPSPLLAFPYPKVLT